MPISSKYLVSHRRNSQSRPANASSRDKQDDDVPMASDHPTAQGEGGSVVDAAEALQDGYRRICEVSPRQKGVQEVDRKGGGYQCCGGAEENMETELSKSPVRLRTSIHKRISPW